MQYYVLTLIVQKSVLSTDLLLKLIVLTPEHLESGGGSGETDFESWRPQGGSSSVNSNNNGSHTTSATGGGYSATSGADPYGQATGYYGTTTAAGTAFPYQAFGVSDGTWSNGTAAASAGDPMTFLGGYATHDSYGVEGK